MSSQHEVPTISGGGSRGSLDEERPSRLRSCECSLPKGTGTEEPAGHSSGYCSVSEESLGVPRVTEGALGRADGARQGPQVEVEVVEVEVVEVEVVEVQGPEDANEAHGSSLDFLETPPPLRLVGGADEEFGESHPSVRFPLVVEEVQQPATTAAAPAATTTPG
ncbi:unnamed protein product [Lampetra fluviatilis]